VVKNSASIGVDESLRNAVEIMAKENTDVLPVVSKENKNTIIGVISYKDIISEYKHDVDEHEKKEQQISFKRGSLKILLRGKKTILTKKAE
ncbi:MAG: CBS domain-containing protein, partial [Bacteroidia bacterium]